MPDTNENFGFVITSASDLAAAKKMEAWLAGEVVQAEATGMPASPYALQLLQVRGAIAEFQRTNVPPAESSEFRIEVDRNALAQPTNVDTNLNRSIATNANEVRLEVDRNSIGQGTNATVTNAVPGATNNPATNAPVISPQRNNSTNTPPLTDGGVPDGAEQLQQFAAIQNAGERLRAAMEQSASTTNAVLGRALETVELQNRRLEDLDRRMSELHGQLKSLKNP